MGEVPLNITAASCRTPSTAGVARTEGPPRRKSLQQADAFDPRTALRVVWDCMFEYKGYLTDKKTHPPGTLPKAYAEGPRGVIWGRALSYGRGTPVHRRSLVSHSQHCRGCSNIRSTTP